MVEVPTFLFVCACVVFVCLVGLLILALHDAAYGAAPPPRGAARENSDVDRLREALRRTIPAVHGPTHNCDFEDCRIPARDGISCAELRELLEGANAPVEGSEAARLSYTIEYRECDRRLSLEPMPDPFVNATVHVRGWRNALRVLFRRYSATVVVSAGRDTVERVSELDPDYLGAQGSPRRNAWNAQLQGALERFADSPEVMAAGPEPEPKAEAHKQESSSVRDVTGEGEHDA